MSGVVDDEPGAPNRAPTLAGAASSAPLPARRGRPSRGATTVTLALLLGVPACDSETRFMGQHAPFAGCAVAPAPPPAALGLPAFYTKYLDGHGIPVVSSAEVGDRALIEACRITGELVAARAEVRAALAANALHVAVLGTGQRTTDIPEYADLYAAFPDTDWDSLRGIGATRVRPVASASEENLLCLAADMYAGQSILVYTLAHALRDLGIVQVDPTFTGAVRAAFEAAMASGLWAGTYATDEVDDYWAAGAQAWFGAHARLPVAGHEAVTGYDPPLAALLAAYLPADAWRAGCY